MRMGILCWHFVLRSITSRENVVGLGAQMTAGTERSGKRGFVNVEIIRGELS